MDNPDTLSLTAGQERRCPLRMPAQWQPPVPAFASDLAALPSVVISCLGVQSRGSAAPRQLTTLQERFARKAARVEQAWHVDAQGFRNDALICYFTSPDSHGGAMRDFSAWWEDPARLTEEVGYWRETFAAPRSHRETLFSANDRPAGLATLSPLAMLGPVMEHGYWGGARDRMPASAHDELSAFARTELTVRESRGRRLRIEPDGNLCIIRSGQDFTDCSGRELELYTGRVLPTLIKGMDFLRDHPLETGCYSCRFMSETDSAGVPTRRSFGLAAFASLAHLERWAQSHPTHLAIFNTFLAMAGELGPAMRLRLWHEVFVLPSAAGHAFEYLNCHPHTGLIPFIEPKVR